MSEKINFFPPIVNILNLCDDILELIEKEWQPRYQYKKVLKELVQGDWELYDCDLGELLYAPPFLFAERYHPDEGGWWFDDITAELTGQNWILAEQEDCG
jgi:hypothetical protein